MRGQPEPLLRVSSEASVSSSPAETLARRPTEASRHRRQGRLLRSLRRRHRSEGAGQRERGGGEVLYEGETIPARDWQPCPACVSTARAYEMPLSAVLEHGQAMPIRATKSVRIEPAVEHD